jgi:hypothetical protein
MSASPLYSPQQGDTQSSSFALLAPDQCTVAFGIPLTLQDFLAARNEGKDLATQYSEVDYEYFVLRTCDQVLPHLRRMKVNLRPAITSHELHQLFSGPHSEFILLVAHWVEDRIELADGCISVDSFIDSVPPSYSGILDLCVCHPRELALKLNAERPLCTVKFSHQTMAVDLWMRFYLALFTYMRGNRVTYLQAFERIFTAFIAYARTRP